MLELKSSLCDERNENYPLSHDFIGKGPKHQCRDRIHLFMKNDMKIAVVTALLKRVFRINARIEIPLHHEAN